MAVSVFNLREPTANQITSPKFFNSGVASKTFAYRPTSRNLALLTRSAGKDVISIHVPTTLEITRSWVPEVVDAQGISWSPDGKWLTVWESAAHGHKALFHTANGHLYRTWNGPNPVSDEDRDIDLGAGVKLLEWSGTSSHVALADHSNRVTVLNAPSFTESMSLHHSANIKATEALQVCRKPKPNT